MHLVGIFPPNVSIGFCDTLQFSVSFPWFSKLRDSTTFFSHSMIGIVCLCVAYAFFFLSFFLFLLLVQYKPESCEIKAHKGDRVKVHYRVSVIAALVGYLDV